MTSGGGPRGTYGDVYASNDQGMLGGAFSGADHALRLVNKVFYTVWQGCKLLAVSPVAFSIASALISYQDQLAAMPDKCLWLCPYSLLTIQQTATWSLTHPQARHDSS